jgi:MraZ protein
MLYSGASDEKPDKQGRVTIPPSLRSWAGLDRECVVIGAGNRIEIWDAAAWAAFTSDQGPVYAEWSEEVVPTA